MGSSNKYSPEVREQAVRMVLEHQSSHDSQWAAIESIAEKIGCTSETLRKWVRQAKRDQGRRADLTSAERERLKALERENRELRRTSEIRARPSAYFAQAELDRLFSLITEPPKLTGVDRAAQHRKTSAKAGGVGSNGGTATGLVGSPETIAERIMAFHEAGVELFLLQFHPMLEEMERFASQVMPLLPLGEKAPEAAEA